MMTNSDANAPEAKAATTAPPLQTEEESSAGRTLAVGAVGAAGAILSYAAIGGIGEVLRLPPELAVLSRGVIPGPEDAARLAAGSLVIFYKHMAIWMGVTGALLGGLMGATVGSFRPSRRSILISAVGGLALGALGGAVAGPLAVWMDQLAQDNVPKGQLTVPEYFVILMHGATWLVIGLGVGLGVGLGSPANRAKSAVESGLMAGAAGLLAGIVFPIFVGILFPVTKADLPIPDIEDPTGRLIWLLLPSVLMGLALGRKG